MYLEYFDKFYDMEPYLFIGNEEWEYIKKTFKREDVKWVEMKLSFTPIIPVNTISYINKVNDNFVCHIEDFEKFYFEIGRAHV